MPSTETLPRPPVAEDEPPGLHLSATQVVASALAAVTATLAASYLGVAGTLIGAAVASVVTVVGNTLYSHSIARTRDRMRATLQNGRRAPAPAPARAPRVGLLRRIGGWRMAAAAGAVFAVLLGVMATVGLVAGRPVTAIVRNEPAHTAAPTVSSTPTSTLAIDALVLGDLHGNVRRTDYGQSVRDVHAVEQPVRRCDLARCAPVRQLRPAAWRRPKRQVRERSLISTMLSSAAWPRS